ncbi:MAG: hypothetical protein ACOWWM_11275 [Desulfobacterales bacterium]
MKNNRCPDLLRRAFFSGLVLYLFGCSPPMAADQSTASNPKEQFVKLANEPEIQNPEIPPIDAAAPSRFETASFGLG